MIENYVLRDCILRQSINGYIIQKVKLRMIFRTKENYVNIQEYCTFI